jgi:hypothetical protein
MGKKSKTFTVITRLLPDGRPKAITGRDAWALHQLYLAGVTGCTPIDNPGPRWSHYVFKLRGMGFNIETVTENHGGQFAGHHARYILRSSISLMIKDDNEKKEAA